MAALVIGTIGTITDVYEAIDARLRETSSSWSDLASSLGVSRQYLTRVLREPKMPIDLVDAACRAVGVDLDQLVEPSELVVGLVLECGRGGDDLDDHKDDRASASRGG